MRKIFLRVTTFVAAILLLTACTSPAPVKNPPSREAKLRQMIQAYSKSQGAQSPDSYLAELTDIAPEDVPKWTAVMDYWEYADNNMHVNIGRLPDGLDRSDSLCIVVLGYQLGPNGEIQPELVGRLTTALECAKQYPNAYILCTGGGTASKTNDTEADQMANWLVENGFDPTRIITENRSLTTAENAIFSCELLRRDYPEISDLVIISSDYHIPWGAFLFQSKCILSAESTDSMPLRVVGNAGFKTDISMGKSLYSSQASGLMSIAGLH